MEQIILTSTNKVGLEKKIREAIGEGFVPVGSHQVVTIYSQNKFSGSQHMATQHELEYSQSMIREHQQEDSHRTVTI
tara:strand:+ start:243 stop:473 length:231 start_codon:yes stop_codon:yes gene_type:complete